MFKHKDLKMFCSETQLQVGENLKEITWHDKVYNPVLIQSEPPNNRR